MTDRRMDAPAGPFVVAHRAGNDLLLLQQAERSRAALVEADVHLFAGRLEVRHLKTVGPLPLLWDRWAVAPPWTPRLELHTLLRAASPGTELMLDLKGRDRRLGDRVAAALSAHAPGRAITVCARSWRLVDPLRDLPDVRLVRSIGGRRGLASLLAARRDERLDGVSIHRRLLTPAVVAELKRRAAVLMTWPIATAAEARELAAWGVDGVITEDFGRLAPALAEGA